MSQREILLIDDDEELGELLTDFLRREGFDLQVAHTANQGLERVRASHPEMVLLDLMLPDRDGFEVLHELRRGGGPPVIMLTAKGEEVDRIVGLEMGADDYLPKPFNPRELSARIKAVLRRTEMPRRPLEPVAREGAVREAAPPLEEIRQGPLILDVSGHRTVLEGREVELTTVEFALLCALVQDAGRVLSRDTLMDRVRGRDFESFDRSIDVHISHLRQKLGDNASHPRFIRTVRSVGYQFVTQPGG
ncbi:MAG: response regulator transcription factor [bacterium]